MATVAISWGIVVGIADGDFKTVVGGAALGFANLVVGAAVAAFIRTIARRVTAPTATTPN